MSVTPSVLSDIYPSFYEASEVCVGIPLVKRPVTEVNEENVHIYRSDWHLLSVFGTGIRHSSVFMKGFRIIDFVTYQEMFHSVSKIIFFRSAPYFSIATFIGLNLVCFLIVGFLYISIFVRVRQSSK